MLTTAYKPTLSCAHCVVSGYSYVYNNSASDTTNTYYMNLATGVTTNPGFCCRKVGAAFICEEDYKIFNFLVGHESITAADVTKVRTLFSNIAASNLKGGETQRDILLSALYAEIGKNITTDKAAILLKWKQTWASAVMYNMINASETSVNGIKTKAKLDILLSYLNAVAANTYTATVEPLVFQLITTEVNSTLLTYLEKVRFYGLLYAKSATNAAAIITLFEDAFTSDANTAQALASAVADRATLVAFTQSTTYSATADAVSTQITASYQKMWLIKNWGYTDYTAAVADFVTISNLSRTVEKGYGTTLNTTFLNQYTAAFSAQTKTEMQQKLYWYKKQDYSQMFNHIMTLKPTIITTSTDLTTAVGKLDTILTGLQTSSKDAEIIGLMVLYKFAALCTANDSAISKANVIAAITNYDMYIKNGAQTASSSSLIADNYSSASFIVLKYAATAGADKTAKDLQMTDLSSVFYWAYQLCLDSTVRGLYDTELSTWKTQSGGSYLYLRDAMMLVNMKNQGTATSSATAKANDWTAWLALIAGNNVAGTQTINSATVTGTANTLKGTALTTDFWEYYGDAAVSITTTPTMWADTATVKDLASQLAATNITASKVQLLCHQLVFLQAAMGSTAYNTTFSSSTITGYLVAGTSNYTAGGTATDLVDGDIDNATGQSTITNIYSASNAANSTYWYKAYISSLNTYASAGLTLSTATSVAVQAPEPTVYEAEPQVLTPLPHDVLAKAATAPVVGAAFDNPDPSASGFITSSDFASKWLALAACPTKVDVCGTRDITAGSSETVISIGTTTAMKETDQCTYIISDATGVPQVSLKTVNSGSLTKYKIAYLEYDDKWTGLTMDTTLKTVPAAKTAFNWVDNAFAYTEGTLGLFKLKNGDKFRFLNANYVEEIIKEFKARKSAFDTAAAAYKTAVTAWDAAATLITGEIAKLVDGTTPIAEAKWTELPLKPLPPTTPNAYAGVHETSSDLTKFNGYGSPTAGEITLDLDYGTYKYFGVFGQGLTDGKLGYSSVTGTSNKIIVLSVYPSSAAAWTQSNGSSGTENLSLGVKSTTASTHDLADPGTVTAPTGPTQVDPWKKALDAKWAAYLNPGAASA